MQWLMLQQEKPEDFVIATGEQHSVREFVDLAASELGISIRWKGTGVGEKGYNLRGDCVVAVDPRYFRPAEVESLVGDASLARKKLGWSAKISFQELVSEMVQADLDSAERDELVKNHGYRAFNRHE
jgi:GDPmannose 4,6-dehydratase